MQLLLAGASGLLGRALSESCEAAGDSVRALVRRPAARPGEFEWHPESGDLDPIALDGIDAVVCLSGAGVGDRRWTSSYRQTILTSRTDAVGTLARAIAARAQPPSVFITASAVGYYGDTGADRLDESAPNGEGFFADVCRDWEAATKPAESSGTRIVALRTGIVLARGGPVLQRMLPLFKLGLGGRLGTGRQYWSWIALSDHVAAVRHLLTSDRVSGPVNLTAPTPVRNSEFARTLGRVLGRPAVVPVPGFALRIAIGGLAGDIVTGQRAIPAKLEASGFEFRYPTLEAALRAELDSARSGA
jgi:uncharacterized protein (TIGR01777 family)